MPYKLLIDDDNDNVCEYEIQMEPGWSVDERINYKSKMQCVISDDLGATISKHKLVELYNQSDILVWSGMITDIEKYEDIPG